MFVTGTKKHSFGDMVQNCAAKDMLPIAAWWTMQWTLWKWFRPKSPRNDIIFGFVGYYDQESFTNQLFNAYQNSNISTHKIDQQEIDG